MPINSNILLAAGDYIKNARATIGGERAESLKNSNLWDFAEIAANEIFVASYQLEDVKDIQVVGLLRHSFPVGTVVQITVYQGFGTSATITYNQSHVIEFKEPSTGQNWGEFSWGDQVPNSRQAELARDTFIVLSDAVKGNSINVTIDLSSYFSAGAFWAYYSSISYFVREEPYRLSKIWASGAFQPSVNVAYGADVQYLDERQAFKAKAGAKFFETQKVRRRLMNVTFEMLPKAEMMSALLGAFHIESGKAEEVIAILEPTKPETFFYSAVYGHIVEPDKATYPWWEQMGTTLQIEEAL